MPKRLLLVDDDPGTLALLQACLDEAAFEIGTARSFAEALPLVSQRSIDLAVVDLRLPDGDGLELCRRFRGRIPVIMLSGYVTEETRTTATAAGAVAVFEKPFSPAAFLDALYSILAA